MTNPTTSPGVSPLAPADGAARRVVLTSRRRLEVVAAPLPAVGDEELTMRVALCGVCVTDLQLWDGLE